MLLVDTHCHLDAAEFSADRERVVAEALAEGVGAMVVPAVDRASFEAVRATCCRFSHAVYAIGIHPLFAGVAVEEDLEILAAELAAGGAVAVGEIGLDFHVEGHDRERQEWYFVRQVELARRFDLPVLLHLRRAQDAILKHLRRLPVCGGIAHAFNGSREQADAFLRLGFKLGFGGAMTYDRATRLRALAASLPADAIVLETDAPDIPPAWAVRQRNVPAYLGGIARTLAQLRGVPVDEVAERTTENARSVLPVIGALIDRTGSAGRAPDVSNETRIAAGTRS